MSGGKWVVYLRVSTKRQGRSELGVEAQQSAVSDFLNGGGWQLVCDPFIETESGKNVDRPELQKALAACRVYGAKLLIAKFDRLSRNAHFLLGLEQAGVDFVCADMPSANRLTVGIMAMVAEEEGRAISKRTKEALAAARRRGTVLGAIGVPRSHDVSEKPATMLRGGLQSAGLSICSRSLKSLRGAALRH